MSNVMNATGERFDFGRVLGQTFGLIGRNFPMFALLALLFAGVPEFAVTYLQSNAATAAPAWVISAGGWLLNTITTYILQGALTRAAVDDLSGARVSLRRGAGRGLRYFVPLFIMALLASIGIWLGLFLLIVPGYPGVALDGRRARDHCRARGALARNGPQRRADEDYRWPIFGLMLLYVIAIILVGMH